MEVDGPSHDAPEQQAFDAARTAKLEALGYLVIRVTERAVRQNVGRVLRWISSVGELALEDRFVPADMRGLDTVPLP